MSISFNHDEARALIRQIATQADIDHVDPAWLRRIETLSRLCEEGVSRTHIAFLGTAMVAKSLRSDVDLFAVKPRHSPGNPGAYSARSLCHGVLVPLAPELGVNIGVTGREPLNNQPYFRMTRLGDDTPVHAGARAAFDHMVEMVGDLQRLSTTDAARAALAAYIAERRRHQPRYVVPASDPTIEADALPAAIRALVRENSENGKRAQAAVAGLVDAFAGPDRVESGRINDPSRRHPGDVCVRSDGDRKGWEKAFEVRDKVVSFSDVRLFMRKCLAKGVSEAAVVAVAGNQPPLAITDLSREASTSGMGLAVFSGWESITEQALFWATDPRPTAVRNVVDYIGQRLIGVEASPAALRLWGELVGRNTTANSPPAKTINKSLFGGHSDT
ncbi:MAG: restriction endonuclease, SacI family [Acidobacteria bacterium]|nr:restriction endonuclease, SacI family [Acidobacteriota bacterium]